jgi:hypothetical protein
MRASATSSTDVLFADSVLCEKRKRFLVTFCRLAKSYPLLGAEAFALKHQRKQRRWIPALERIDTPVSLTLLRRERKLRFDVTPWSCATDPLVVQQLNRRSAGAEIIRPGS